MTLLPCHFLSFNFIGQQYFNLVACVADGYFVTTKSKVVLLVELYVPE